MADGFGGMGGRGFRGGFKRRREEEQPMDPEKVLLSNMIYFGDKAMPVSYRPFASVKLPLLLCPSPAD